MSTWENNTGESDEWYTPPGIFQSLGVRFALDPCSPGLDKCYVPADHAYTQDIDGLSQPWFGCVFMNPPFGGRNGHLPWLDKFIEHANGIAVVRAYTSSQWFHDYIPRMDGVLFPRGKTKFIRPDGSVGGSPGHGIAIVSMGRSATDALRISGLGIFFVP